MTTSPSTTSAKTVLPFTTGKTTTTRPTTKASAKRSRTKTIRSTTPKTVRLPKATTRRLTTKSTTRSTSKPSTKRLSTTSTTTTTPKTERQPKKTTRQSFKKQSVTVTTQVLQSKLFSESLSQNSFVIVTKTINLFEQFSLPKISPTTTIFSASLRETQNVGQFNLPVVSSSQRSFNSKVTTTQTINLTFSSESEKSILLSQDITASESQNFGQFSLPIITSLPVTLESSLETQKFPVFSYSTVLITSSQTSSVASPNSESLTELSPLWWHEQFRISPNQLIIQERNQLSQFVKMALLSSVDCGDFTCSLEYHEEAVVIFLVFENFKLICCTF